MLYFLLMITLPRTEQCVYGTFDKGKTGIINVRAEKDTTGYRVFYGMTDRTIEILFDTLDMSTRYLKKVVKGRVDVESKRRGDRYKVNCRGNTFSYHENKPVYDRHALEYALRGFEYSEDFKRMIRLSIPEFMIVNAEIRVDTSEVVSTSLGDVECWKVRMTPRIILIKRIFFFWIEKDYPHRFVKMEDSSGKNKVWLQEYHGPDEQQ